MKLLIILSFALLGFIHADDSVAKGKIHIPEKCSDVLAVKACDRLQNMATKLKLKSEEVKNAVINAYKQGKTKSEEIYKSAKDFLKEKILTKKCEDLTSLENCQKLRNIAAQMKVQADKVAEFVMKEIATLKTKECEDFLDAKQCTQLKEFTGRIKIKYEELKDMMVDAYLDAKTKGTKIITETYNKVKTYVMSTRCEDVFNPQLCGSFRKYAEKTKVAIPKIKETALDLVQKGIAIGKDLANKVYDIVDYFYDCDAIFDKSSCDRLERWAAKLRISTEEFTKSVKKYVRIAIEKGTSIYKTIKDFIKQKLYCRFTRKCINKEDADEALEDEMTFGNFGDFKQKLREILNKRFPNLDAKMRAAIEKLITKAKSYWNLMRSIVKEIKANASTKWAEFLKKVMIESVVY